MRDDLLKKVIIKELDELDTKIFYKNQDMVEGSDEFIEGYEFACDEISEIIKERISELQPTGRWNLVIKDNKGFFECTNCRKRIPSHNKDGQNTAYTRICPNCNAKMRF